MRFFKPLAATIAGAFLAIPAAVAGFGQLRPHGDLHRYRSIVILGTAQYDGVPSRPFAGRLRWAAELWQHHRRLDVVALGGKLPGDRYSEAEVARIYCLRNQVDPSAIITIPEGHDTETSLRAACDSIAQPCILVTDPLHALRTQLWAHHLGIQARVSATKYSPERPGGRLWWKSLAHESGGVLVFLIGLCNERWAKEIEHTLRSWDAHFSPRRRQRFEHLEQLKDAADNAARTGAA